MQVMSNQYGLKYYVTTRGLWLSSDTNYYDDMVDVIAHFSNIEGHAMVMGDLNFDCSDPDKDSAKSIDFIEHLAGLSQIVNG